MDCHHGKFPSRLYIYLALKLFSLNRWYKCKMVILQLVKFKLASCIMSMWDPVYNLIRCVGKKRHWLYKIDSYINYYQWILDEVHRGSAVVESSTLWNNIFFTFILHWNVNYYYWIHIIELPWSEFRFRNDLRNEIMTKLTISIVHNFLWNCHDQSVFINIWE